MTDSISMYNDFIKTQGKDSIFNELETKDLKINTFTVSREQLADYIKNNQDTWFMYTDEVRIGSNISFEPQRFLLEAEYASGKSSVRIKLLHGHTYLVSIYEIDTDKDPDNTMCYFEQEIIARRDLQKYVKKLKYRIWYKLANNEDEQVRWVPWLQQFIGFAKEE